MNISGGGKTEEAATKAGMLKEGRAEVGGGKRGERRENANSIVSFLYSERGILVSQTDVTMEKAQGSMLLLAGGTGSSG